MAFRITDRCISCGSCVDNCPASAISEGLHGFEINPDVCASCGMCADVCPLGAISEIDDPE